ncbi:MAG: MFS transporter [Myxococcota bacterium]|jgi:MFS family permease|nr:MFS transporter [Myxococcota bacterium]
MAAPETARPLGQRVIDFLGLRRSMVGMLGMVVLVGLGERMGERFLPLYLQQLTSEATAIFAIGLLAGLDDLLSALYAFPGGYLSDRLGAKRALLVFNLLSILGYLLVILVPAWWAVLVGAALFISWSAISLPATMELVARVVPKSKRTMGVSLHSLVRRVPKMLGPLLGGVCIASWGVATGIRVAFGVAVGLAVVALFLQQGLIADDPRPTGRPPEANPRRLFRELGPDLRQLLLADILVRFCERIPDAFVVIWATRLVTGRVTELEFGVLSAVESLTALLIYVPVAYFADRFGKKPFVVITFGFFTAFPLVLLLSHSFWPLLGAFVVRGLKEFGEPTRKALIMDLAPEGRKAAVFGLYYLIRDVVVSLAAFGGAALWALGPEVNLLTACGCGVLGTLWFVVRGRDLPRPGLAPEAPPASDGAPPA